MELLALLIIGLFSTFLPNSESVPLNNEHPRVRREENGNKLEFSIDVIPSEVGSLAHNAGSHGADGASAQDQINSLSRKKRDLFGLFDHPEFDTIQERVHHRNRRSASESESESESESGSGSGSGSDSGSESGSTSESESEEEPPAKSESGFVGIVPALVSTLGLGKR